MTIKQYLLFTIPLVALVAGGCLLWLKLSEKKTGYVVIQSVFEEFDYTKEVRKIIVQDQQMGIRIIDSLKQAIETEDVPAINRERLDRIAYLREKLVERDKAVTADYNAKIWAKLNKYLQEFGAAKRYDFLFGAEGSGTLMYADSTLNATKEAVVYINKRYADVTEK